MRQLIVNADDFGISEGVNRGIVESHRRGILTSTTLMANMPAFEQAVALSGENPDLGVGLHLNLTAGVPILPPSEIPTLVGEGGRFLSGGKVLRRLTLGRLDLQQIESELGAQIEKALAAGIALTHLDSHHHIHTHPALQPIAIHLALRYGIGGVRSTVELGLADGVGQAGMLLRGLREGERETVRGRYLKAMVLSLLGRLFQARARQAGLATPSHFRGILLGMAFGPTALHRALRSLPEGATELMCHPGYLDAALKRETSYSSGRDSELRALTDPVSREIPSERDIRLVRYSDLTR